MSTVVAALAVVAIIGFCVYKYINRMTASIHRGQVRNLGRGALGEIRQR